MQKPFVIEMKVSILIVFCYVTLHVAFMLLFASFKPCLRYVWRGILGTMKNRPATIIESKVQRFIPEPNSVASVYLYT